MTTKPTLEPPVIAKHRPSIAPVAMLGVLLAYCLVRVLQPVPIAPVDDGYITLHSAQVMHAGGMDPNYPGVSPLQGATSAPFLGLVYLLTFALPPVFAIDLACWLGTLAYVLGLVSIAESFQLSPKQRSMFVVLGATCSFVPFHLINGMETSWMLAAITWTLHLASQRRLTLACLAAGAAASIRPDLITLAFAIGLFFAFEAACNSGLRTAIRTAARCAGTMALVMAPWAAWYLHATGTPYPETALAKLYFFGDAHQTFTARLASESGWLLVAAGTLGPLCIAGLQLWRTALGKAALLFLAIFFGLLFSQVPDALSWNRFRYPMVCVPILLWGLASSLQRGERSAAQLLRACWLYALLFLPVPVLCYVGDTATYLRGLTSVATWCNQNLPAQSRLLVHDAGYIPTPRPFVWWIWLASRARKRSP